MKPANFAAMIVFVSLSANGQQAPGVAKDTSGPVTAARPAGAPGGPGRVKALPIDFADHDGWSQIFDGTTLTGWDGDPKVWGVVDGAIVGRYDSPTGTRNAETFVVLKDKEPADFELKLEIKLEGDTADSGIQYRSYLVPFVTRPGAPVQPQTQPQWHVGGYQFDFNFINTYPGQVAEGGPNSRGIIAYRGQVVRAETGKPTRLLATLGTTEELGGYFKINEWNQVHLIVRGHEMTQIINGHVMAIFQDDDAARTKLKGLIALQCAGPGTVKISFRDIYLREMK